MMHGSSAAGLTICGLGLLLAGCSGWSYDPPVPGDAVTESRNLSAVRAEAPQSPANFNQALTSGYANLATSLEQDHEDWKDVDYFSRKGLAAASGSSVPPEANKNWLIPLEVPEQFRSQLDQGRERLVAALDGGARDRAPAIAARAQVSYDCWVERMEDDWRTAADGPCHQQFLAALGQLENRPAQAVTQPTAAAATPPATAREYRIYFNFNRADLVPDAQHLVQQIAEQAKQDGKTRVVPIGKADRAGSDQYNLALSRQRAEAVREALVKNGVPASQIDERWVGERQPPVPTPAGAHEPRNRVVEIILE
jgi:OOP family OmpA-OmpF porin